MTSGAAFVFGKLPTHGDFVARGLTASARDAWDAWLSAAMERGRNALGDDFEAAHDSGPPWRFVEGPGARGGGWRAGALAPSVDSVGRRFFIVVGRDDLSADAARDHGAALAEAMADLLYRAFSQGWTADDFVDAASAIDAPMDAGPARGASERWWCVPSADGDLFIVDGAPETLVGIAAAPRVLEAAS